MINIKDVKGLTKHAINYVVILITNYFFYSYEQELLLNTIFINIYKSIFYLTARIIILQYYMITY